jgi:hypothetical protein
VETDDIYEDLKELNDYMDFSDYPKTIQIMMLQTKNRQI